VKIAINVLVVNVDADARPLSERNVDRLKTVMPPGAILQEEMKARGATVEDITEGSALTFASVLDVLDTTGPVTEALASQLAFLWGTPATLWLRLESMWQEHLAVKEQS
jgi:plasmid maintenance system antidote protein VapI